MPAKRSCDIERIYSRKKFAAKLRRFATAVASGRAFRIQVAGERLQVPADAHFSIEHERAGGADEVEFQIRWRRR